MTNDQLINKLDQDVKNLKPIIEFGNSVERLRSNRDFNKVIVEGYLKQEALRLVHAKSDPNMQDPDKQAAIVRDIDAIGTLYQFLSLAERQGDMAKAQLDSIEEARSEVLEQGE